MNIFEIAGHLGRDPETRFTANGQKVTTFTVAVNHRRGGKEDVTMWVRVTVWGDRYDKMLPHLKKGSAVIVLGELQPPTIYSDKEGRQQVSMELTAEIIKFSPFGRSDRSGEEQTGGYATNNRSGQQQTAYQDSGYGDSSSQGYGRNTPYASSHGQGSMSTADDDALPF